MDLELDDLGHLEDADDGGHLVFEGKGKKGKIYQLGDYWFTKDRHNARVGKTYFRCREYRSHKCPVRSFRETGARELSYAPGFGPQNHTCDPNPMFGEFLAKRKELIEVTLKQPRNGPTRRQIFLDFVQNIADPRVRQEFSFHKIEAAVEYYRRKACQNLPCPRTFQEVDDLLSNPDSAYLGRTKDDKETFYQGMVGHPGEESLVFASKRMLSIPKRHKDVVASDATFKITPRLLGAMQVLVLSFFAFGKCFPMAMVVMKAKTTEAYATALNALKDLGMPAHRVITDWETAERNGWKAVYPSVELWGCLWHYIRCLFRKVKKAGLQAYWKMHQDDESERASEILRLCCALPRLPSTKIKEGYAWVKTLLDQVAPVELRTKVFKILEYVREEWVEKYARDLRQLSVYERDVTSSSGQEGVHRGLNAKSDKHPIFPDFLELAKEIEDEALKSYQYTMASGRTVGRTWATKQSNKRMEIDQDITEAKKTYAHTNSVKDFLVMCQSSLKKDFMALKATPDDDPIDPIALDDDDDDDEEEEEERMINLLTSDSGRDHDQTDHDSESDPDGDVHSIISVDRSSDLFMDVNQDDRIGYEYMDRGHSPYECMDDPGHGDNSGGSSSGSVPRQDGQGGSHSPEASINSPGDDCSDSDSSSSSGADGGGGVGGGAGGNDDEDGNGKRPEKGKTRRQREKRRRLRTEKKQVLTDAKKQKRKERAKLKKKLNRQREREATANSSRIKLRKTAARRARLVARMRGEENEAKKNKKQN